MRGYSCHIGFAAILCNNSCFGSRTDREGVSQFTCRGNEDTLRDCTGLTMPDSCSNQAGVLCCMSSWKVCTIPTIQHSHLQAETTQHVQQFQYLVTQHVQHVTKRVLVCGAHAINTSSVRVKGVYPTHRNMSCM